MIETSNSFIADRAAAAGEVVSYVKPVRSGGLYELHVTVNVADAKLAEHVAQEHHWKTSQITGDPVLGNKPFFYLTTYTETEQMAYQKLYSCAQELRMAGIAVLRAKIEHIIYDVRY